MSHLGRRLSALIDDELSHLERDRALAHLARCEPCREEAVALRALKQRMLALGETTAAAALTDRLMALAALPGVPGQRLGWSAGSHREPVGGQGAHWPVRGMAVVALVIFGLGVPAAAYMAGSGQRAPGPRVTPAVDLFMVQHSVTAGTVPAPPATPPPATSPPATPQPSTSPLAAVPASHHRPGGGQFASGSFPSTVTARAR